MKSLPLIFLLIVSLSCKKENTAQEKIVATDTITTKQEEVITEHVVEESTFDFAKETIGGWLSIGTDEATVKEKLGTDFKTSINEYSQVTGYYEQEWLYEKQGIKIVMEAENPEAKKTVAQITVLAASKLKTSKNIGIGSAQKDILSAYHGHINTEEATDNTIIVGSIYEGLFFTLKNNKVSEIFIGAIAE
ncbi:hypothetical protein R1T16_04120 [Flavobacterium sp. DG1-102-2]|uniref:hypothetical protein n=1 Tax=Flavobacterium sp. DG1-102-2 TaxID=3081663 RepID=UPI00294A0EB9|nr:hypothetical protein [Flavobacterium sp. DG1-102-2]MDV6167596.1 hypothetical protein [Flavobacterium sp. DG1-102-2]